MKQGVVVDIFNKYIKEEVFDFKLLSGGYTNYSYLIVTNENKYVLRIPGNGTDGYINRKNEEYNIKQVDSIFTPKIYVYDNAIIISNYVDDERSKLSNEKMLELVVDKITKLHNSNIKFLNEFNIFENFLKYTEYMKKKSMNIPEEIKIFESNFRKIIATLNEDKELVPCHVDLKFDNFIISGDVVYIIDWEYSGMADRYFDIANFILTSNISKEDEEKIIRYYEQSNDFKFKYLKYNLYKLAIDYLWIFWHLIQIESNRNIEYNIAAYKKRFNRFKLGIKEYNL